MGNRERKTKTKSRRKSKSKGRLGTCAYCAKSNVELEDEHVFPDSWFPDGTPRNAMLIVPSCRACNQKYDKIEKRLFAALALTLPSTPENDTISERAIRSVVAMEGKSVRDVMHRRARGESLQRQMNVVPDAMFAPMAAWAPEVYQPGPMVTPAGLHVVGLPTVKFDKDALSAMIEKLHRGCYYEVYGAPLSPTTSVWTRGFTEDPRPFIQELKRMRDYRGYEVSPFQYGMVRSDVAPTMAMSVFVLWDHHCFLASSNPPASTK